MKIKGGISWKACYNDEKGVYGEERLAIVPSVPCVSSVPFIH